jgi:hypothetical protein
MAKVTILLGVILIALGLYGYFVLTGDEKSITALIPAFFGLPLLVLGVLALKDAMRKVAMHIAVVIGVLGFVGTLRGLVKLPTLLTSADDLERPAAIAAQSIMGLLCLAFVLLCVASFVHARRSSQKA